MKLPDDVIKEMTAKLGHSTFSTELTMRDKSIAGYCANIAEAIDSGRGNEADISKAIYREFGLQ